MNTTDRLKVSQDAGVVGAWCPVDILFDPKQFWMLLFLLSMFLVLGLDVTYHINPTYYLNFLTFLGSFFVGGQHLLEYLQSNKTETTHSTIEVETPPNSTFINEHREPKDFAVDYSTLQKFKAGNF